MERRHCFWRTVGKHETAIGASVTRGCVCPLTADRAKLSVLNTMSRIRGREKPVGYPQTEGMLGDCMLHYGQELGAASEFGTVDNGCMLACLMLFLGSFLTALCFAVLLLLLVGPLDGLLVPSRMGLFTGWSFASPPFFVSWSFFCLFLWHVHFLSTNC